MLAGLKLPPGFSVRINYDPDKAPLSATVTAFREGKWLGETMMAPEQFAEPGQLQRIVDFLTKRGVRG